MKWQDADWLGKTIRIQRGLLKQILDDVKSVHSARTMVCADELLNVLKLWRQSTEFSAKADWAFASPWKLTASQLLHICLRDVEKCGCTAGIGLLSSHTFRDYAKSRTMPIDFAETRTESRNGG